LSDEIIECRAYILSLARSDRFQQKAQRRAPVDIAVATQFAQAMYGELIGIAFEFDRAGDLFVIQKRQIEPEFTLFSGTEKRCQQYGGV
jgi:hypothetical protein